MTPIRCRFLRILLPAALVLGSPFFAEANALELLPIRFLGPSEPLCCYR